MTETTITGKILSIGLGAWIQYQRACKRTEVLSESYLTGPIVQLLNSYSQHRVIAEFRHPVLAPLVQGSGRRPTTDFVVCDHDENVHLAIETKWIGRTSPEPKKILWDLIRLALIQERFGADCYFILGGQRKKLLKLSEEQGFIDKTRVGWKKPLLRFDNNALNAVRLDSVDAFRRPMLRELYQNHQETSFPTKLTTQRASPFLTKPTKQDFEIFVWKLVPRKVDMMKPRNNSFFHQITLDN